MISYDFSDRKVLLTGASGGIGISIAKLLVKAGAEVVISGTNEEKLNNLKNELGSDNVHPMKCNLMELSDVAMLVKNAKEKMGKLDILICNAGLTRDKLSIRMSDDDFADIVKVNLTSNFVLNREAIKIMNSARYGRIINISSVVGLSGNAGQANYASAKAGLVGMTKTLAQESARRSITVNAIAPGFIRTPMTDSIPEAAKEKVLSGIPMAKYGEPEDVANAVMFLASEEASYISGAVLNVNGGLYM